MTHKNFKEKFPTELAVIQHYINIRYNGSITCNHCGCNKVHPRINRPRIYQCSGCRQDFSIFKGTIFEKSTTDLVDWFYAIHLFLNAKKGISGLQLQRELGVTYKTAWRMLNRIRLAMGNINSQMLFEGIVEMDETYIGGKPRKNFSKNDGLMTTSKRGRGTHKIPVIGIKDRTTKQVFAKIAEPNVNGQTLTGQQLLDVLSQVAQPGTIVMTDEFRSYRILSKQGYIHFKINHQKEFVNGDIHTNGIESFWSTLKRAVYGIYHQISFKYLQNYIDEFCFRYNHRCNGDIYDKLLLQTITLNRNVI